MVSTVLRNEKCLFAHRIWLWIWAQNNPKFWRRGRIRSARQHQPRKHRLVSSVLLEIYVDAWNDNMVRSTQVVPYHMSKWKALYLQIHTWRKQHKHTTACIRECSVRIWKNLQIKKERRFSKWISNEFYLASTDTIS